MRLISIVKKPFFVFIIIIYIRMNMIKLHGNSINKSTDGIVNILKMKDYKSQFPLY